jgi:outer membrane biosynthesis protein TonB
MRSRLPLRRPAFRKVFALSDVPALLAELDKCLVDLRETWNIGKDDPATIAAVPKKPLGEIFRAEDYPLSALQGHDQGSVEAVLLIDEVGKIRDCSIESSSEIPTLDTMSCYVFQQRADFAPAIGKSGQPLKSIYTQRITWRLAR